MDELKNISVQLDSETAKQIAEQYITYRYFDSLLAWSAVIAVFVLMPLGILFFIRSLKR